METKTTASPGASATAGFHPETTLPDTGELQNMAEQFRLFGDTNRLRILWALAQKERCVRDLAQLTDCSQSAVSHQLRLLRSARLVRFVKKGKTSVYSLDDNHVGQILALGFAHIKE